MKNKILKGGLIVSLIPLLITCNLKNETPLTTTDKEKIKTEIQALEDAFATAINDRNLDKILYYADDAISFSNEKKPLAGREAIHDAIKGALLNYPKGAKVTFETKEVHISNDMNQVVEIGQYQVLDSTATKMMSGNYISLFEKRDGKYICIRDMVNSDMPRPKK